MSRSVSKHFSCDDFERVQMLLSRGEPLPESDLATYLDHLATCKACRLEAEAAELFAYDGTDGPAVPARDELANRRWINEIVRQARLPRQDTPVTETSRVSWRNIGMVAALGIAACVLFVAAWFSWFESSDSQKNATPTTRFSSRIVMTSQDVSVRGALPQAQQILHAGDIVSTAAGSAVLRLAGGVSVKLDADTRVKLVRPDTDPAEIFLISGRLFADVKRHPAGMLAFTVSTHTGRVEVTGTVFSVQVAAQAVDIQVLEGSIRISDSRGRTSKIGSGQAALLGNDSIRHLSAQETSTLALKTEPLEFFRQDREARLTLKSQPEGALAKINGSTLGRTPLSVTLNGGECEVEVSLDGYLSQRERIVPVNGEELIREVVLSPVGKSSSAANSSRGNAIPTQPEQTIQEKSPSRKPQLTTKETATDSPGAHDLLNQARERRQLGDWAGAAKMYQMLIERFPDQSETGVALTGLGEIQLSRLRKPAVAMRSFDEYLRRFPNGVLTQEAAFGRIRALRQLGLEKEEAAAIQRFIAAYPNAIQARAARLRLKELEENP